MICRRQGRRSQRETIRYICDFSRCRLNVRLCARIHPLLRGHKYSVLSVFGCWSKIRINVGEFGDSSEQVQVADEQLGRSETKHFYRLQEMQVRLFISPTLQIRFFPFLLLKQRFFLLIYIIITQNQEIQTVTKLST